MSCFCDKEAILCYKCWKSGRTRPTANIGFQYESPLKVKKVRFRMTKVQLDELDRLQKEGWTVGNLGGCCACGGPVEVQDPDGNLFVVNPDGSLTEVDLE